MINLSTPAPESPVQILIVEDERVIARDIRVCLENLGYLVPAIAVSGEEAIAHAAQFQPHLILMDIRLQGEMDGIQAAEQIWQQFQIPFIYSTGYSDRSTLERARATAPFGYILKPVEERELFVAIETALQRYRLDVARQQRERWLTTILNGIADGVIVVDRQMRIRFLNPAAEVLLGVTQADVYEQPLPEIFQVVDEQTRSPIDNPIQIAFDSGQSTVLPEQILLITPSGRQIPIADSAAPLFNEQGVITGAVLVFRDMTEKRLIAQQNEALTRSQQLQEQMLELQRLNRMKDDFLSTVSHELRTPLTNIKLAIRMLEINLNRQNLVTSEPTTTSSPERYLEILRSQCDRELSLINDLLDLQRLNADAYNLELSSISLPQLLTQLMDEFQVQLQDRQLTLQLNLADNIPPILSDPSSLNRILAELLTNACKYTPSGEQIIITVRVNTDQAIELNICNTGVEIAPEDFTRIFEPFYRIPQSDRWQRGGTGLGLSLVKKLVTVLRGAIDVTSKMGQTCFILTLPAGEH